MLILNAGGEPDAGSSGIIVVFEIYFGMEIIYKVIAVILFFKCRPISDRFSEFILGLSVIERLGIKQKTLSGFLKYTSGFRTVYLNRSRF
jgi:hypothetical protein